MDFSNFDISKSTRDETKELGLGSRLDTIDIMLAFDHFSNIKIAPSGISRAAKKLLQGKVPDLSRFNDISDFMYRY